MKNNKDKNYIEAFRTNNQRLIREMYESFKPYFINYIVSSTSITRDSVEDIYQESVIRLQQNILNDRLTDDKLDVSLSTYLNGIGYHVAMEWLRKYSHEISNTQYDMDRNRHIGEDQDLNSDDEIGSDIIDTYSSWQIEKREQIVRRTIMEIGEPCAPLLLGFYWHNKSMQQLASELKYASADVAKNQKSRCMKKISTIIRNKLNTLYQ